MSGIVLFIDENLAFPCRMKYGNESGVHCFFWDTAPVPQRSKRHDQDNDLSRPHVLNVVNLPKGNLNKTCGYLLFAQQPRIASIDGVVLARSWWYIDRVTQLRLTQ